MKQLKLNVHTWGGKRPGAGRKRIHSPGVSHRKREKITRHTPVHINLRYETRIRNRDFLEILKRAILSAQSKGMRILHYSVQSNHLHFIVEANTNRTLTSGMRALTVTIAKGISTERVQIERYHLHVLRYPKEARNAVQYVVYNEKKHTGKMLIDSYSSLRPVTGLDQPRSWPLSSQSP